MASSADGLESLVAALAHDPHAPNAPDLVDDIARIGTRPAFAALARLLILRREDGVRSGPAVRAAWRLAAMVRDADYEEALRTLEFPDDPGTNLAWAPFRDRQYPDFERLMNTVSQLIAESGDEVPPDITGIDPRLVLCPLLSEVGSSVFGVTGQIPPQVPYTTPTAWALFVANVNGASVARQRQSNLADALAPEGVPGHERLRHIVTSGLVPANLTEGMALIGYDNSRLVALTIQLLSRQGTHRFRYFQVMVNSLHPAQLADLLERMRYGRNYQHDQHWPEVVCSSHTVTDWKPGRSIPLHWARFPLWLNVSALLVASAILGLIPPRDSPEEPGLDAAAYPSRVIAAGITVMIGWTIYVHIRRARDRGNARRNPWRGLGNTIVDSLHTERRLRRRDREARE